MTQQTCPRGRGHLQVLFPYSPFLRIAGNSMSVLNGVVAMNLASVGHEEPSTPLRDPTSSPAVHIQWQNSQSACAAMEELRVASSKPRCGGSFSKGHVHTKKPNFDVLSPFSTSAPQPLSFGFELPPTAGPSSTASDPFLPSRTRSRSVRSRTLARVQSHSQDDVLAIPAADASKFLDMLGRASARVDENSRKRMRAREGDIGPRAQKSSRKGKERMRATTTVMVTRSMDELGDQTNLRRHMDPAGQVHYSSLPIMQSKGLLSQEDGSTTMRCIRAADKKDDNNEVHMHAPDAVAYSPTSGDAVITIEPPVSTRPQNGTNHRPPCSTATTTIITKHSQKKRLEPPSPTPIRPAPTPIALRASAANKFPVIRTSTSPPKPSQGSILALPASQAHGSKRALGMTRNVPRAASANNTPHSAAVKKPFRPPLARATQPAGAGATGAAATSPRGSTPTRTRQADDGMSAAADPDSSFDLSFDFDPEALEAAMKKYD